MGGAFGFGGDSSAGFGLDKTKKIGSWVSRKIVKPGDQGVQMRGEKKRGEKRGKLTSRCSRRFF